MEGHKPIPVTDATYDELIGTLEKGTTQPIARQKSQQLPTGCGLVVVVSLPGPTMNRSCSGSCGIWDRFLGRSCQMVGSSEGGGLEIYCTCSGGWFDRIFG